MSLPNDPLEYRLLLRDRHPKRSVMHKIHRWRHTNEDDDAIAKVILCEKDPNGIELNEDLSEKIYSVLDKDWTNLRCGIYYSLGKHKRWLLPDLLEKNLPDCEDYQRDLGASVSAVSHALMRDNWTHACGIWWYYHIPSIFGNNVERMILKRSGGYMENARGSYASVKDKMRSKTDLDENPCFQVQFQTRTLCRIPRLHNSRIYDYHSCSSHAREYPTPEGLLLDKDIPRSGHLKTKEEIFWMDEEEEVEEALHPSQITFGDFLTNIRKERKKKRVTKDLNEWVFL